MLNFMTSVLLGCSEVNTITHICTQDTKHLLQIYTIDNYSVHILKYDNIKAADTTQHFIMCSRLSMHERALCL